MTDDGGLTEEIRRQDAAAAARRAADEALRSKEQAAYERLAAAGRAFAAKARELGISLDEFQITVGTKREPSGTERRGTWLNRTYETTYRDVPILEKRQAWAVSYTTSFDRGSKGIYSEGFNAYVLPSGEVVSTLSGAPLDYRYLEETIQKMAQRLRASS